MTPIARRRWATLAAVHLFFFAHWLHGRVFGATLAPLEVSEALRTVHLGVVTAGFLLLAGAIGVTFVFGRFFCGWGCHLLALQDLAAGALARLGWTWTPPRWRVLRLVPGALLVYLVAWPIVLRLLAGTPWPGLHFESDPRWGSFWTTDPWRNLPGPWLSLLTLVVSAPILVAARGPRSFCRDVCPYGACFGVAERLAPVRLVLGPGCTDCGACNRACRSNVDVLGWLRSDGAVRDPACIRDLDCVAACPTAALRVDRAPVRAGTAPRAEPGPPLAEELAVGAVTLGAFLVFRDLYDTVPVLLAAALAVLTATTLWRALAAGRLVRAALVALVLGHCAVLRVAEVRADAAYRGGSAETLARLEAVAWWGVWTPPSLHARLGSVYLAEGRLAEARVHLDALVAARPDDAGARRALSALEGR